MTEQNELVLIREYMVGTERYELGLPKDRIDAGESAAEAANRELAEEASFSARRLNPGGVLSVAPAYAGFETHLFFAAGLTAAHAVADEPEAPEVVRWSLNDARSLPGRDDFTETRARLAVYMLLDNPALIC